jgi:demethylmenaquinone methyltransferase/2-methoxy-6-polyprenyl-1,4-benzoquinol methylase
LTRPGRAGNLPAVSNDYYAPGAQRASRVNALFARIAQRYDLINDLQSFGLHRRWKRRLVELARPRPGAGKQALDVCCGTGDIARALAATGAEVTGLDFSAEMLAVAHQRDHRGPTVNFCQGDAMNLPFAAGSFDTVTVGYGLRNLADWHRGLQEMVRVARPGGCIAVLEFGKPDFAPWRWMYFTYLRLVVPILGLVFCRDAAAYAYILESLRHYPAQHGLAAAMRDAGLTDVAIVNFLGGAMTINLGRKTD